MSTKEIVSMLPVIRGECGVTQTKLSEITGMAQPMIARYESGKKVPTINSLLKLLEAMGYTLAVVPLDIEAGGAQDNLKKENAGEKIS